MKNKCAFNLSYYLKIQKEEILKRISSFGSKLYLEFGGKLFDDYHAARVLPGFAPDAKLQLLLSLKNKTEIIIVVSAKDITTNKIRNDLGITYQLEVERLIEAYARVGLSVNSVLLSMYEPNPLVSEFEAKLTNLGVKTYKSYPIKGYPQDISLVLSDEGLGKNDYIETSRPLVVVTAPGPGSGKMACCLSQLYHDQKHGINAGYAKYETFPIWNLSIKHPVNLAYEAATVDLEDVNMIDPFHLEHYGKLAVNYNRDVETFPLLKTIFDRIYGKSPYFSPTDMGVNMAGFAISNDEAAQKASKDEIIRRYFQVLKYNFKGRFSDESVNRIQMLMNQIGASPNDRKCVQACLTKRDETNEVTMAMELSNGKIVTGKRSALFGASAALLLNALKCLGKINDSILLISPTVIEPIQKLKIGSLHKINPRINAEEILIALALQANTNPLAQIALKQLPKLKGAQAHSSCLLTEGDFNIFKKLEIDVTEEPISYVKKYVLFK